MKVQLKQQLAESRAKYNSALFKEKILASIAVACFFMLFIRRNDTGFDGLGYGLVAYLFTFLSVLYGFRVMYLYAKLKDLENESNLKK